MTGFAPLPEFARGPDIPAAGYAVTDLGGGVYGITQGMINTMFLVAKKGHPRGHRDQPRIHP